ncbi:PorV/PorQ family protein [candidate division KSB1 bacterium]|nr:PorV/PorQ family protein [candidate division KSB1 bacterium]RQW07872.1 MAG: PorV/PorQ family protein [candidate division KSB1 bacterium]
MKQRNRCNDRITACRARWILGICLILLSPNLLPAAAGVGYHAAPFLKISPAARQVGMGGAYTALSQDVNVMRYNIGGLDLIDYTSLAMNFNSWIDDTQQGSIAFALPSKIGAFGVDLSFFNEGKIIGRNADFVETGDQPYSSDLMASLGYGYNFGRNQRWDLGVGVAVKYLSQSLVGETSGVVALDAGAQFSFPEHENVRVPILSLGAAIQNYGLSKMKFDVWESPLPETYRAGAALNFRQFPLRISELIISSDATWTTKEQIGYQLGSELLIKDGADNEVISVRGGYRFNDPSMANWALGFGVYLPTEWLGKSKARFDYAYAPLRAFDEAAHRFSLHFAFGAAQRLAAAYVDAKTLKDLQAMAATRDSLDAALRSAQDTEARLRALEKEMQERLDAIKKIAAESEGKIEVAQMPDDARKILVTMRINFDFDKANIRPDEYPTMQRVGEILNTYPNAQMHLSGHTDWIGTDHYNIHLSHRRIDSVMTHLSRKENVAFSRFFMPVGYGESRPIDTNDTDDGRFRNRRVEFLLFTYDAQPEMPAGTAIKDIVAADANTIHIVCNGIIPAPTKTLRLSDPERFVLDFDDIYLIAKQKEFILNVGPVNQARAAEHIEENFTRVVLDVTRPIDPLISVDGAKIVIKLR